MGETSEKNGGGGPETIALDTLGDVRRFIAQVVREVYRGSLRPDCGGVVVAGLGVLAKVMQDQRDTLWTKRSRQMWEAFQKGQPKQLEATNAQH